MKSKQESESSNKSQNLESNLIPRKALNREEPIDFKTEEVERVVKYFQESRGTAVEVYKVNDSKQKAKITLLSDMMINLPEFLKISQIWDYSSCMFKADAFYNDLEIEITVVEKGFEHNTEEEIKEYIKETDDGFSQALEKLESWVDESRDPFSYLNVYHDLEESDDHFVRRVAETLPEIHKDLQGRGDTNE